MPPYYSLLRFDEADDVWYVEFGDPDRETVEAELEDYAEDATERALLAIITTDGTQAAIDAAAAAQPKPQAFTVELCWWVPHGKHMVIYADDAAAAFNQATSLLNEGDIEYDDAKEWDDACSSTEVSGLWAGHDSYAGPDLRTKEQLRQYDLDVASHVAPLALTPEPFKYTVILKYPDWEDQDNNGWGGTWQGHVEATNADASADMARIQLINEAHPDREDPINPDDYIVVAIFPGHLESLTDAP